MTPRTSHAAFAALLAATTLLAACTREPLRLDEGPLVDAEYYARGFCAARCYRLDACGVLEGDREACKLECTADAMVEFDDDLCWEERIELRRCIVVSGGCELVPGEDLPIEGTECEDEAAVLAACGG